MKQLEVWFWLNFCTRRRLTTWVSPGFGSEFELLRRLWIWSLQLVNFLIWTVLGRLGTLIDLMRYFFNFERLNLRFEFRLIFNQYFVPFFLNIQIPWLQPHLISFVKRQSFNYFIGYWWFLYGNTFIYHLFNLLVNIIYKFLNLLCWNSFILRQLMHTILTINRLSQ